ncbi:MAG: hypothetical protein ACRC1M_04470 [Methanobacteriaceae archaeon]
MHNFLEDRNNLYVIPIKIENKEKYIYDLQSLDYSVSDRLDLIFTPISHLNYESVQLIINSIYLFELGYFDAAFYSLRQSIEISTTMVFLSELSEEERIKKLEKWSNSKKFPMRGEMIKHIKNNGEIYKDMLNNMPNFFDNIQKINKKLNKFVHKQGIQHFYSANSLSYRRTEEYMNLRLKEFEYFLKECICIVAIMRLALDPFPILLRDEEISFRVFDILTEPYNDRIVSYINDNIIDEYKLTDIYQGYYEEIIKEEKRNSVVNAVVRNRYVDLSQIDKILEQKHLLNKNALLAVYLFRFDKINSIFMGGGSLWYGTHKTDLNIVGLGLHNFSSSGSKYNQKHNDFFVSAFRYDDDYFYLLHEEVLSEDEINEIKKMISNC